MLKFEEYLNLVQKQANEKLTGDKQKFFEVLKKEKENAKEADKKVTASISKSIFLPSKYKNETFAKVISCYCDDYNLAMEDMEDPEKFAAILSILNDKLAKDGDVYDMSTPETKMLGLANRYANNARECQYARQWRLFAFYMRSLAYFIPQLIEKANMTEEKVLDKIEAKLNLIKAEECPICHCDPCECDGYGDDVSDSGLTAGVEITSANGRIVDRDGEGHDSIELKPGQWCWYFSKNDTKYSVHNAHGKMKAFKNGMNETMVLPDMKKRIKMVSTAATELSYQELYDELDEKFRMAKNSLDRIEARYKYRTLQNVSYNLEKANKLQDELWNALDKIDKEINKLWSKIG